MLGKKLACRLFFAEIVSNGRSARVVFSGWIDVKSRLLSALVRDCEFTRLLFSGETTGSTSSMALEVSGRISRHLRRTGSDSKQKATGDLEYAMIRSMVMEGQSMIGECSLI